MDENWANYRLYPGSGPHDESCSQCGGYELLMTICLMEEGVAVPQGVVCQRCLCEVYMNG